MRWPKVERASRMESWINGACLQQRVVQKTAAPSIIDGLRAERKDTDNRVVVYARRQQIELQESAVEAVHLERQAPPRIHVLRSISEGSQKVIEWMGTAGTRIALVGHASLSHFQPPSSRRWPEASHRRSTPVAIARSARSGRRGTRKSQGRPDLRRDAGSHSASSQQTRAAPPNDGGRRCPGARCCTLAAGLREARSTRGCLGCASATEKRPGPCP